MASHRHSPASSWRATFPSVVSTHSRDFQQNLFLLIDGVIPATRGRVRSPWEV